MPYSSFTSYDGLDIRYGFWRTVCPETRGIVIFLGGRTEYMEKHLETVGELGLRGYDVYSMDWRGQGLSSRMLENRQKGYVSDYQEYLNDLYLLVMIVKKQGAGLPLTIISHSMGGHIAIRFLHDHGELISNAVFVSPMIEIFSSPITDFCVRALVSFAKLIGLKEAYAAGSGDNKDTLAGFENNPLTSDPVRFERGIRNIEDNPQLALGGVTYGWLGATFRSIDIIMQEGFAERISTPILLISGSRDSIVSVRAHWKISAALSNCRMVSVKGARHEVLCEKDRFRDEFWREFDKFMVRQPG